MLVGRTTEQRRVEQVLDAARAGRASVLRPVGDPGQGKTALLADAESRAEGMAVLRARGVPSETHVPFAGLFELLRPALGLLGRLPAPQARALEGALALRPGTAQDRFAVGAATLGLLAAVAEETPLLVLVDDAHALDDASASALLFAVRRALADAIAVLLAARPEPSLLADAGLPVLELAGLDREAAGELVRRQSGSSLETQLVDRLHRETGGNPLALLELAGDPLVALGGAPPGAPLPVVPTVAEVYRRRCRALGTATQRVLLLVAAGEGSDLRVLSRAARSLGADLVDLVPAEAAGLVAMEAERVVFRHPLMRSAVYAEGTDDARREVHRALASALPDVDADRRAWHLALAALGPDDTASTALEHAGDRARTRSAYDVASRAYERAERLATDDNRRSRLGLAAADSAWLSGHSQRALLLLDELQDRRVPPQVRSALERLRGHIATRCGPVPRAREILLAAAEQVCDDDPDTAVVLLAEALHAAFYTGHADAMRSIADRITLLVPSQPSVRTDFFATMARGMALLFGAGGDRGASLVRQALAMIEPSAELADDPLLLVWLTLGPLWLREVGAEDVVDVAVSATRERLAVGVLPFLLSSVAICRAADRWPEAEAGFAEAIELGRETGQRTDLCWALSRLSWLEARQGKQMACREHVEEALSLSTALELGPCEVWSHAALIDLELGLGRPERALEHAEDAQRVLARMSMRDADLLPGPELVDALLRLRQVDRATEESERYMAAARAKGQPWALARAVRCQGMLATGQDVDALFEQALALHARTPDVFETARTQLAYGSCLRRAGHRLRARDPLREATVVFDRLGAAPWGDLARAELAATGETARSRHPGTARDLTPQELHLALLLAGGQTTRETAAAVFLSPKTVEYHLRSVYRKLGIRSREELAAVLAEPGEQC